MSKQVFILRHGNTFDAGDQMLRVGAGTDLPLSKSGQVQAQALGQHFKDLGVQPDLVFVSPLKRTQETAQAIINAQPQIPAWQIDPRLNELDYGPDEGKPEEQVIARVGQAALDAWDSKAHVPAGWPIEPQALVMNWMVLLEELRSSEAETILLVTSNGTARFVLPLCEGLRPEGIKLKTAAYGALSLSDQAKPEILSWNLRA